MVDGWTRVDGLGAGRAPFALDQALVDGGSFARLPLSGQQLVDFLEKVADHRSNDPDFDA
jgi:hypothetical protein